MRVWLLSFLSVLRLFLGFCALFLRHFGFYNCFDFSFLLISMISFCVESFRFVPFLSSFPCVGIVASVEVWQATLSAVALPIRPVVATPFVPPQLDSPWSLVDASGMNRDLPFGRQLVFESRLTMVTPPQA